MTSSSPLIGSPVALPAFASKPRPGGVVLVVDTPIGTVPKALTAGAARKTARRLLKAARHAEKAEAAEAASEREALAEWAKAAFGSCDTFEALVAEAIGAASVCWESPSGAGVFESARAAAIADAVAARGRALLATERTSTVDGRPGAASLRALADKSECPECRRTAGHKMDCSHRGGDAAQ